jgi:7-carboxy-7-deazaguanine synthase
MSLSISEKFVSIQGEGKYSGLPHAFVRTKGCNIDCTWCDTPQRFEGTPTEEADVVSWLREQYDLKNVQHVCFTGGEPMMRRKSLLRIMTAFPAPAYHVETNGTIKLTDDEVRAFDSVCVSPKPPSAQHKQPLAGVAASEALQRQKVFVEDAFCSWLGKDPDIVYFKFVVDGRDWDWIRAIIARIPPQYDVYLQPQTYQENPYLDFAGFIEETLESGFPGPTGPSLRFTARVHELCWGDAPGR